MTNGNEQVDFWSRKEEVPTGSLTPTGESAEGPLEDFWTRTKMAYLGDTLTEKETVFRSNYPEGEMRLSPSTNNLQFKINTEDAWKDVDLPFARSLGKGGEFLTDVSELILGTPEIIPEISLAFKTKGVSLIPLMLAHGTVGALSEIGQQSIQSALGTQDQTFKEAFVKEPAITAGFTAGGALAGRGIERAIGVGKGGGLFTVGPEGRLLQKSARELGVSEPLPGQVITSGFLAPIIKRLSGQSAAGFGTIGDYLTRMERETLSSINNLVKKETINDVISGLSKEVAKKEKELLKSIGNLPRDVNYVKAGRNIQQGIAAWDNAALANVNTKFKVARKLINEDLKFDISNVLKVADDLESGVIAALKEPAGDVKTFNIKPIASQLKSVIDDIGKLDPNKVDADVLQAIQQRIFDLTLPPPGQASNHLRLPEHQAKKLYEAVKNAFENPLNKGTTEFSKMWKAANKAAAKRFETLEKIVIRDASMEENASQIAMRLIQPFSASNVATVRKVVGPDKWKRVQDEYVTHLMGDGQNIIKNLDALDKQTLYTVLSKFEINNLYKIGHQLEALKSTGIKQAALDQNLARPFIDQLLSTKSSRAISEIKKLIGPSNSSISVSVRSGIIDNIVNKSEIIKEGVKKLDYNKLDAVLNLYEDKGILNLLLPQEVHALKNSRIVMDFMRGGVDAGTSLMAATQMAGIRTLKGSAIQTLVENIGVGRILTSGWGRRMLIGSGKEIPSKNILVGTSVVLSSVLKDIGIEDDKKSY